MTYVSRRARIIIPRWPNESDTDFLFRTRRRCDGRLKRHSSAIDLRSWINNSCIQNEYLLELMSDGEVTLDPPFQLYGRFIPVPLLFKLTQKTTTDGQGIERAKTEEDLTYRRVHDSEFKTSRGGSEASKRLSESARRDSELRRIQSQGSAGRPGSDSGRPGSDGTRRGSEAVRPGSDAGRPGSDAGRPGSDAGRPGSRAGRSGDSGTRRESWEAKFGPKSLDSGSTVNKDDEFLRDGRETHKSGSDSVLAKVLWEKNEIEKHLFRSTCLLGNALLKLENIDTIIRLTDEETENIRKGEIQEAFRRPKCICSSTTGNPRCTGRSTSPRDKGRSAELLKCNELLRQISSLREKLKKNQEHREILTHEITLSQREVENDNQMTELYSRDAHCHVRKLERKLEKLVNERGRLLSEMCHALTQLNNLKKTENSQLSLRKRSRSDENRKDFSLQGRCNCICRTFDSSDTDKAQCSDSSSSDEDRMAQADGNYLSEEDRNNYYYPATSTLEHGQTQEELDYDDYPQAHEQRGSEYVPKSVLCKDNHHERERRRSKLRFYYPPCPAERGFPNLDRHLGNPEGTESDPSYRPSTSPTTRRERTEAEEERWCLAARRNSSEVPERRVKSETTMLEIEKTLRNYEQRLNDLEGIEYKVEDWKKKLLEACRWKSRASKIESTLKKERDDEREKCNREISVVCTENRELKKQVRTLMEKFREQAKKIQNLKCSLQKAKELECEAEQLKKDLTEYRNGFEQQRKCISKWESVVAVQRKDIENLMNHIKKLTADKPKDTVVVCCQDKTYVQRSRSFSPEAFMEFQDCDRPQTHTGQRVDGNASCCCQDFRQPDARRKPSKCKNYYPSVNESDDWCN